MRPFALVLTLASLLSLPAVAATGPASAGPAADAPTAATQSPPLAVSLPLAPIQMLDLGAASFCSAQATCADGTTRSCSCTSSSCSCYAIDQNCNTGVQGHVTCGSTTYSCPLSACGCIDPPRTKCIPGLRCEPGCGNCGPGLGECDNGSCLCGF